MVCTANDLLEWKEFPKGLRVLLLDQDKDSASEITSKLEQMDYIVSAFSSEHDALSAISSQNKSFHVAIVEVTIHNRDGRYKFLETAKDLPTIMTSKEHCLSTMMKCIALGAVEFLVKPLSEEKLRNIWQHVVHKAFNASGSTTSESLIEFVGSVLEVQQQSMATEKQLVSEDPVKNQVKMNQNEAEHEHEHEREQEHEQSSVSDKFPAPSTPQLKQGGRFLDDGDYHDQINSSPVNKESGELENGETKFVDTTIYGNSVAKMEVDPPPGVMSEVAVKEEENCDDGSKGMESSLPKEQDNEDASNLDDNTRNSSKESCSQNSRGSKGNRKKIKVDWTPELHKRFVQAVEKLGVDQAIPSRILELMKVEGLTRHNVASHLQKYRMNRRHILPKEDNQRRWPHPHPIRDPMRRNYYPHQPVMAFPPYHGVNHSFAPGQVYPMWGPQGGQPPGLPVWAPPPAGYPWQPVENWHWKPYPGMHADAWGCPVMPPPAPCHSSATFPQQVQGSYGFQSPVGYVKSSGDVHPGEEEIDKVVKEAISKPWLPLPIGLKPPSTDSVLAELSKKGISTVPPHHHHRHRHHPMINGQHPC